MTVQQVAAYLKLGRSVTYDLVRRGIIPSVRLGHQYRIVRERLLTWLESEPGDSQEHSAGMNGVR